MQLQYGKTTKKRAGFVLFALLSACSLWDTAPKDGFPQVQNENETAPNLAPTKEFDFDQDRQIPS